MMMRFKSAVEIATNLALAAAAVTLVWRLVYSPVTPRAGEPRAAVEDVESKGLSMALSAANRKGAPDAEVVLLEFSDYQCPYCGKYANETFGQIDKAFVATNRVQYAFHNYPLGNHSDAIPAAVAAECSGEQGKYWEMHDRLFTRQAELSKRIWLQEAPELQLDLQAFERCLSGAKAEKIRGDMAEASRFGVNSTPTFFIGKLTKDGQMKALRRISGAQPYAVFERQLNEILGDG
ncbi:MAG: DsbA family protein [Vicinamibacterales bacterium]